MGQWVEIGVQMELLTFVMELFIGVSLCSDDSDSENTDVGDVNTSVVWDRN